MEAEKLSPIELNEIDAAILRAQVDRRTEVVLKLRYAEELRDGANIAEVRLEAGNLRERLSTAHDEIRDLERDLKEANQQIDKMSHAIREAIQQSEAATRALVETTK